MATFTAVDFFNANWRVFKLIFAFGKKLGRFFSEKELVSVFGGFSISWLCTESFEATGSTRLPFVCPFPWESGGDGSLCLELFTRSVIALLSIFFLYCCWFFASFSRRRCLNELGKYFCRCGSFVWLSLALKVDLVGRRVWCWISGRCGFVLKRTNESSPSSWVVWTCTQLLGRKI